MNIVLEESFKIPNDFWLLNNVKNIVPTTEKLL